MADRRDFLSATLLAGFALALPRLSRGAEVAGSLPGGVGARVVSTWDFGVAANRAAWGVLGRGGRPLDAVEAGVMIRRRTWATTVSAVLGIPTGMAG
jgi:N4-(beta-N-acetylglucosaminyl)-L-asparaginase